MGTKKWEGLIHEGLDITHSICQECKEKVLREMEEDFVQNSNDQNQGHLKWDENLNQIAA